MLLCMERAIRFTMIGVLVLEWLWTAGSMQARGARGSADGDQAFAPSGGALSLAARTAHLVLTAAGSRNAFPGG